MKNMKNGTQIDHIRHSLSHLLAAAVLEQDPAAKLAIGPTIENGFYYDFQFSPSFTPSTDLLPVLETRMRELIRTNIAFEGSTVSAAEAHKLFAGQPYKLELIDEVEKAGEKLTVYRSGSFTDLCAGGHVKTTEEINPEAFTLTHLAGAYWRGSEKNTMLTRIYGVAFETKQDLNDYLKLLEEAKKRDHRKLGQELDLFMTSDRIGQGLVMFLPKGALIYKKLQDYMYEKELERGYHYVQTPVLAREDLYKRSGHLAHYHEDMYNPLDIEGENYYLKPMNCPHHHIMYRNSLKSYRDLPYRLADFGMIHRYERSGVLTGIIRARNFSQNDAHIYCRKDQVKEELKSVMELFNEVYEDFDIKNYWFRLSLPDYDDKEKYGDLENRELWEYSAQIARDVLNDLGATFVEATGEAAFYGPKIDVQIKNVLGKEDTIATCQIDFYSPERFDLTFINEKGEQERPVIIHRAVMGSFERFFAFLIEKTAGAFPLWLSPVQVKLLPISDQHASYAASIAARLRAAHIRVEIDSRDETLGKKIRQAKLDKVPYFLVLGERELAEEKVKIESRDHGDLGTSSIDNFIEKLNDEIARKE
jgi:threonyl-tRNA synthetase